MDFVLKWGTSGELSTLLKNAIIHFSEFEGLAENFCLKVEKEFSYLENGKKFNKVYELLT